MTEARFYRLQMILRFPLICRLLAPGLPCCLLPPQLGAKGRQTPGSPEMVTRPQLGDLCESMAWAAGRVGHGAPGVHPAPTGPAGPRATGTSRVLGVGTANQDHFCFSFL